MRNLTIAGTVIVLLGFHYDSISTWIMLEDDAYSDDPMEKGLES